jgi:hypothetical protein
MTAKEKAIELIDSFEDDLMECDTYFLETAKQRCALKVVDEILNIDNIKPYILHKEIIEFYQEVKQEIEKL